MIYVYIFLHIHFSKSLRISDRTFLQLLQSYYYFYWLLYLISAILWLISDLRSMRRYIKKYLIELIRSVVRTLVLHNKVCIPLTSICIFKIVIMYTWCLPVLLVTGSILSKCQKWYHSLKYYFSYVYNRTINFCFFHHVLLISCFVT